MRSSRTGFPSPTIGATSTAGLGGLRVDPVIAGQAVKWILTADHGEMAGSHRLRQEANLVYDENFHVPRVIRHPDFPGGTATGAMASAVDLAPTLLAFAGLDEARLATDFPRGGRIRHQSRRTVLGRLWRSGRATTTPVRRTAARLHKRGFLRGFTDERYSFGCYFSPLEPNRPNDFESLVARNDVVLYDRAQDPGGLNNLAVDDAHRELVAEYRAKLERLISDEIGDDQRTWVLERPNLVGWPVWRGDAAA
jgi:arylsulfatase